MKTALMRSGYWALLFALCVWLSACGADDKTNDGAPGDSAIGCLNDPRAQIYTANLQQKGYGNLLTFVLKEGDPAPPAKGTNTWTVKLLDGDGNVVTGGTILATPYMPDHGHGTAVAPETMPSGDSYTITPLYLFMPGLWQVTLQATTPAADDSAVFNFCIPG